ncbi:hypothetical protein NLU13_3061 [Sarocladium strictum]|uniref:Uncharacterized protein n=1 Tax=Sarocladium strictum TaxID=5046 RepID=A0AA39GM13_SARSR|nr:hypothetical protein NLU13_3061 [Sarocladium strictum]
MAEQLDIDRCRAYGSMSIHDEPCGNWWHETRDAKPRWNAAATSTPVMSQRNWVNPPDECSQWKCFHGHLAIALPGAFWDALTSLRKMQRLGKRPWSSRPGFPYPSSYSPIRVLRASNPRIKSVESWLHITVRSV